MIHQTVQIAMAISASDGLVMNGTGCRPKTESTPEISPRSGRYIIFQMIVTIVTDSTEVPKKIALSAAADRRRG